MTMSGLFGIGSSALAAFQSALNTTAHNIANVNTEGYSRQQVEFGSRPPQYTGYGYIGTGVDTKSVERIFDNFVESQVRGYTASSSELEVFHNYATQIDNVLADPDAGLSTAMQRFFGALQDLADDPTATAARQVVVSEAQALTDRFHSLNGWLEGINDQVNASLEGSVDEVNRLTTAIADLNHKIVLAEGVADEQPPNDLLDQRDSLIRELAEHVSVTTSRQDDGSINVMVGTGQALVVGNSVTHMTTYRAEGVHAPLKIGLHSHHRPALWREDRWSHRLPRAHARSGGQRAGAYRAGHRPVCQRSTSSMRGAWISMAPLVKSFSPSVNPSGTLTPA